MVTTVDCTKDASVYVSASLSMDPQREGVAVVIAGHLDPGSEPDKKREAGSEPSEKREADGTSRVKD
jgi:hypothetical protein